MKKIISALFSVLLIGCSPKSEMPTEQPTLKISVHQSGKVLVKGSEISLDELNLQLAELKSKNGVVWYYRETGEKEPPEIATEVIATIIKYEIPVSLSSKSYFSDFVDVNGQSKQR